jgi:hypothetical protein
MDSYTPICYDCHVLMQCTFEQAMVAYPEEAPNTLWAADVYECPLCHKKVVAGQADEPLIRNAEDLASYLNEYSTPLFILKG